MPGLNPMPSDPATLMAGLLGLGIVIAAAAALAKRTDLEHLSARAQLAARRALAAFHPRKGELWHRWALQASRPDLGVAFLEEAARRDHAEAHFELGLFFEEGGQGPGGRDSAARHYRAAAELGHLEATYRLAELLRWGVGPSRDPGAAHRWYLRSALGGFRPAMDWLVRAFEFGEGVPEDLEKAVYWTVKAQALPPVKLRASHFAGPRAPGRPAPTPEPPGTPEGEAFFRQGMSLLGEPARDPLAARIWLLRAAQAGHVEAMAELADLLACGHREEAQAWFQRAGDAGHKGAQIRLGQLQSPGPRRVARG